GEAAVERKARALPDAGETHDMAALLHMDDAVLDRRAFRGAMRDVPSVRPDEAEGERYVHQPFAALRGRRRPRLLDLDDEFAFSRIVRRRDRQVRRTGLMVPQRELLEVEARHVLENLQEVFDGCGFAVMALEIEVHALAEQFRAEDRLDHANDF